MDLTLFRRWHGLMAFALATGNRDLFEQLLGMAFMTALFEMEQVGLYYGPRLAS